MRKTNVVEDIFVSEQPLIPRLKWREEAKIQYLEELNSELTCQKLQQISISCNRLDVNNAVCVLNSTVRLCARNMICIPSTKTCQGKKRDVWFDNDCRKAKSDAKKCLKNLQENGDVDNALAIYHDSKSTFNDIKNQKRAEFIDMMRVKLEVALRSGNQEKWEATFGSYLTVVGSLPRLRQFPPRNGLCISEGFLLLMMLKLSLSIMNEIIHLYVVYLHQSR